MTHAPRVPRLALALAALLAGAAGTARGEDGPPAPAPPRPAERFVAQYPYARGAMEEGTFVLTMVEGVHLSRGSFSVDAANLVLWFDPERLRAEGGLLGGLVPGRDEEEGGPGEGDGPREGPGPGPSAVPPRRQAALPPDLRGVLGPVLHALYAEGGVVFRLGTRTVRCERLFVDFRRDLLTTGRVQFSTSLAVKSRQRTLPLILRAERMRRVSADTLLLEDGSYTTCEFEDPHFRFRYSEFLLTDEEDVTRFTAYRNVLEVGPLPVFYLPVLSGSSDLSARPLRSVAYRSSSRFGQEVNLLWGDDIMAGRGRWGEWRLRTDERLRRGPGIGPGLQYDHGDYQGEIETYYQRDGARRDAFDDSPVPRKDRGRVRWEHRHGLSPDLRLDLSLHDFSDRNFQPEYLKDEYLEGRDPETYAWLRWSDGIGHGGLGATLRPDAFRTDTTELPAGTWGRIGAPVPAGGALSWLLEDLSYSVDGSAGAYERAFDEDLPLRGDRRLREDAVLRVEGVRWVGPFSLVPFASAGGTLHQGVEIPGEEGSRERGDLAVGMRATVEARRDFPDAASGFFGFRGLRHLVELEGLWFHRVEVSEDPLGATAADPLDDLREARVLGVRLRNRLQALRGGRRVDWIDLELRALRFPGGLDGAPPVLGPREEGLDGARFQDFTGEEKYRAAPLRGDGGPYEADLRLWLRENLFALGEVEYDPYEESPRTTAAGVRWFVIPRVSLYAGNRRIEDDSNILTFSADWAVSERWMIRLAQQTDFRSNRGLKTTLGLRRVWHDFVVELGFENDRLNDDVAFQVSVIPSFLWTAPTSAERLGRLDYEARRWYR